MSYIVHVHYTDDGVERHDVWPSTNFPEAVVDVEIQADGTFVTLGPDGTISNEYGPTEWTSFTVHQGAA